MSLSKKSKLIIGGGVTLAIIIAIGVGVGVTSSDSPATTPTTQTPTEKPVENAVKSRVESFLDVGLEEDTALKTEITNLAIKYDTENGNVEATEKSLGEKIREYLNKQLETIKTKITEMETNEDRSFFPEIDKKVTELKGKQTKLETLISDETYVGKFLNGEESLGKVQAVVFENLPRTQQGYKELKQTYINTFTKLRDLANIQDPDAATNVFTETLNSINGDTTRDYIIRETHVSKLIENFASQRIIGINTYLESFANDDVNKYSDVKTSYDKLVAVKASIEELTTYLSNIDNLQAMLEDETLLNTKFQQFNELIEVYNKDILDKYTSNKEDIKTRALVLTNIITTISASSTIKSNIGVTDEDVTSFTNQATSITDGTQTLDKSIETLENLENSFFEKVKTYENIGIKTEQIKTALVGLEETDADYISLKPIYDYFSNKVTVLKDLSSTEGLVKFQAQVVKIKAVVISDETVKESIKSKIDALLALSLTPSPTIRAKLVAFKTELDSSTVVLSGVEAKINTEIQNYLTVHIDAIKAEITKYQDLRAFDEVDDKLTALTTKQTTLESLNTTTIWNDIKSGITTIARIGESTYTTLTREPISYNEDLTKYKAALLHLKTKFENISEETQTSIQTIHDALVGGTSKVSEVLRDIKTLLLNFVVSRLTYSTTLLDSVPAADRNLYTDVKTIFDSIAAAKTTYEATKTYLEGEGNINTLLLSSTTDIDSNINIPSDITTENKALVEDFVTNKESLKTRTALLTAIKVALGENWITRISGFLPAKGTLFTDITTHEAITTYDGLLTKLETLETKIYNEIIKYKNTDDKLTIIKTEIDSLVSTPTAPTYIKLKEIYDYLKNENGVLKDVSTETGVNKLIKNINKLNNPTEFGRSLILKLNMYDLSINTPTGDNREKLLDEGEFKLIETTGFYCGGTTQEEVTTKLQQAVRSFQEKQTYVVKPHSIKANSNFKVTFPKYRDQENVEIDCWEVEVSDYPKLSRGSLLTQEEGYKYAIVRSNSNKEYTMNFDYEGQVENNMRIDKMIEDTGVYCEIGIAINVLTLKGYYPNYDFLDWDGSNGANIKGNFIYNLHGVATPSEDAYCFKLFLKVLPPEATTLSEDVSFLTEEKDEFSVRVNNFKTELETLSTDTPKGPRKIATLNYGIYTLALKHGVYCSPGDDTVEQVQSSLNGLSNIVSDYILFVRPTITVLNSNSDITFTKFKDENNKVVKCWDVEVGKVIPGTNDITSEELDKHVEVYNNIERAYNVDKVTTEEQRSKQLKKLYEDTNITCITNLRNDINYAVEKVRKVLPNYRLVVRDDAQDPAQSARGYFLEAKNVYLSALNSFTAAGHCWRVAPSSIYSFTEVASQPQTKGLFNAGGIKVDFDTFGVYGKVDNTGQSSTILNELALIGKDTKLSHRYQITFKDSRLDVAGKGKLYNIVFRIKKNDDGNLTIVIEDAFYRTATNTATTPSDTWDEKLDVSGGTKVQLPKEDIKLSFDFLQIGTISTENAPTENIPKEKTTAAKSFEV